jgi:hypothetical protein
MTFASEPKSSSIIYSSWKCDIFFHFDHLYSLTRTLSARSTDSLACTTTALTLSSHNHDPLMKSHITSSLTTMAFLRFRPWFGPCSLTNTAITSFTDFNCLYNKLSTFFTPFTDSENYKSIFILISSANSL